MTTRSVQLRVQGLVQGVSFRASACDEARRLGLRGWVRNLPNGDVEARAGGPPSAVEAFIAWCQRGPDEARVTGLQVVEADGGELPAFEVRR